MTLLLNPGPTNTAPEVKQAQTEGSDVCHRTPAFLQLCQEVKQRLLARFSPAAEMKDWHVALIGGSGTLGLEAMIASLFSAERSVHVVDAGAYGKRAVDIMSVYGLTAVTLKAQTVGDCIKNNDIEILYYVQHETSTGENFPTSLMCERYPNARLFIDATSAFGAVDYTDCLERIDALSFCSNKCLQSTPGVAVVIWRQSLAITPRCYYADLAKYTVLDNIPFTLPTQSIAALNQALMMTPSSLTQMELFDGRRAKILADLIKLGISCINHSPSNTIIGCVHPTKTYPQLEQFFAERDMVIYSGIPGYSNSFRLSFISVLFDDAYPKLLQALKDSLSEE